MAERRFETGDQVIFDIGKDGAPVWNWWDKRVSDNDGSRLGDVVRATEKTFTVRYGSLGNEFTLFQPGIDMRSKFGEPGYVKHASKGKPEKIEVKGMAKLIEDYSDFPKRKTHGKRIDYPIKSITEPVLEDTAACHLMVTIMANMTEDAYQELRSIIQEESPEHMDQLETARKLSSVKNPYTRKPMINFSEMVVRTDDPSGDDVCGDG